MARRLEIERTQFGNEHRVALRGQIDENAELQPLASDIDDRVRIDLAEVSFVNSLGLREWIRLLMALQERSVEVVLQRCSESMVHQMSMVVAAQTHASVESFFCPFECDECGHAASVCIDVATNEEALRRLEVPPQPCPECGAPMQLNELPERYLLFLEAPA
jgi:anti-anti-sigma regulatory factor